MIRQTNLDPAQAIELPRLMVGIFQDGKLLRYEHLPDPRERLCGHFNSDAGNREEGYRAVPVSQLPKKRRRAGWQVIIINQGQARCYLAGVSIREARDWAKEFNDELDRRGVTDVRAFPCNRQAHNAEPLLEKMGI